MSKRKIKVYFVPHQDDELLTMGIDICTSVLNGDEVHVVLCTDGSKSKVRQRLNNGQTCWKHEGIHCYDLNEEEFVQARDTEFFDSCLALGVKKECIHIPSKRDVDGSLSMYRAETIMKHMIEQIGKEILICTIAPNNGSSQHKDHKTIGSAAHKLLNLGNVQEVKFFVEPYHYLEIYENPRLIPFEPDILTAQNEIREKVFQAIQSYKYWNPEKKRYAVGFHSVTNEFKDYLNNPQNISYVLRNKGSMTLFEKLDEQHRKWKKLQKQRQYYYYMNRCEAPDFKNMRLVFANDEKTYQFLCEQYGMKLREKDVERIQMGSLFYGLSNEEGMMVSTGWVAWKHHFYIGEMDFGFEMKYSDSAILYDFNTKPEYRGNGYYGLLLRGIVSNFKEAQNFIIYTSPDNFASDRGILKAGFEKEGTFCSLDGSMERYLKNLGFVSLKRKYVLKGLFVRKEA